jgi:phosphatidylserine/phosphatidylglycerophosphate/cardiolipin synthase-like enzyme
MNMRIWSGVGAVLLACAACGAHADHGEPTGGAGGESTATGAGATGGHTTGTTSSGTTSSGTTTGTTSSGTTTGTTTITGSSDITVYVTPDPGIIAQMVTAIEGATTSVHMTMYILDNTKIVAALVAAKKAGRDVRVVMNQTFPSGTNESNPATYTTLTAAGIGVVWRNGPPGATSGAYTHEKTFVVDGKQAWIMTLNLDASSAEYNREYVVVDNVAADVTEADTIFLADYAGTASTAGSPLVVSPVNSRAAMVALIAAATKTVDVEDEEFSDTSVVSALVAARKRNVAVRVVLANDTPTTAQTSAIATVKAAGGKVVVSGGTSGGSTASNPYIHAKAILIDCNGTTTCTSGFVGSENITAGSLGYNRELGLIIENPTELAKVETAIDADFAAGTPQ